MEPKKSNRGGARAGAGRKPTGRKAPHSVTIMLSDEEYAYLSLFPSRASVLREALREYAANHPAKR